MYATRAVDNTDPAWPSAQTFRVKVSAGIAAGAPVLLASGGYHDGLSQNGGYLATGYRQLHLLNLNTASDRILFTGPANGKARGDTSQVCNVSMQPHAGPSPDMLLLDFGYGGVSSVVRRPYGMHEILFRIDTLGRVVSWYRAPKGFTAWQDAEWSNQADFAVATGENSSSGYPAVVALNLRDSVTTVLAQGFTLRQPGLWIRPGSVVFPTGGIDSLGLYNEPVGTIQQEQFAGKMKFLWLNRHNTEVVGFGSSHVMNGIWPLAFTHYRALNLGYSSAGTHYVLPNYPALRALIVEVHPGWMNAKGGDFIWWGSMDKTKGYRYDSTHGFWSAGVPAALDTVMQAFHNPLTAVVDGAGGMQNPNQDWGARPPPVFPDFYTPKSVVDTNVTGSIELLRSLAESSRRKGVHLVLTLFPQSPAYRSTPYYGKYGPTWAVGRELVAQVKSICDGNPFCHFYDAYQEGNHDYRIPWPPTKITFPPRARANSAIAWTVSSTSSYRRNLDRRPEAEGGRAASIGLGCVVAAPALGEFHGMAIGIERGHGAFPRFIMRRLVEDDALGLKPLVKTVQIVRAELHVDGALLFRRARLHAFFNRLLQG